MVLTLVKRGGMWQGLELDNEVEEATIMKHIGGADLDHRAETLKYFIRRHAL